jgi:hypothetical protein
VVVSGYEILLGETLSPLILGRISNKSSKIGRG